MSPNHVPQSNPLLKWTYPWTKSGAKVIVIFVLVVVFLWHVCLFNQFERNLKCFIWNDRIRFLTDWKKNFLIKRYSNNFVKHAKCTRAYYNTNEWWNIMCYSDYKGNWSVIKSTLDFRKGRTMKWCPSWK